MNKKLAFWLLVQASTILLYIILIGGGYALYQPALGWGLYAALFVLHLFELKTALNIGREKSLSTLRVVVMNLLFGFTWWVPLKRGIIKK
ncbi:MAG: hypothetical protein CVU42_02100 [Chloroflexi bacterium HGW-Chloroflexi-4]|nr:MAG: hypothetical protein CVU42_02100 [Chloroflexi bacterium HGW-Chloroflexi-4]